MYYELYRAMEIGEASECLINGEENAENNTVGSTLTPLLALSSIASLFGSLSVGYAVSAISSLHALSIMCVCVQCKDMICVHVL